MYRTKRQGLVISAAILLACIFISWSHASTKTLPEQAAPADIDLVVSQKQYSLSDPFIGYRIVNNGHETAYVVMSPSLQRKTQWGWERVALAVGFCGTADPLYPEGRGGKFPLEWCSEPLLPGEYRLVVSDWNGNRFYGEFEMVSPCSTQSAAKNE